jgi:hypothetical protein
MDEMEMKPSIDCVTGEEREPVPDGGTTSSPVLDWSGNGLAEDYCLAVVFEEFVFGQELSGSLEVGEWEASTLLFNAGTYKFFLYEPDELGAPPVPASNTFTLTFAPGISRGQ